MPERSYRVVLWSLALIGLAADQSSKYGVFAWLQGVESHTFAIFQTEPTSRFFAEVPLEETLPLPGEVKGQHRGFFLEAHFQEKDGKTVPYVNQGALFGWKAGLTPEQSNWVFAAISLLAAGAIIGWSMQKATASDCWLCISLGLILAGTLGNFYDRLLFTGVRDFLHWHYSFDWPVFNIADCCLVTGAGLLLLQAFFVPASQPTPQEKRGTELAGASTQG